ncbi:hypothetical protein J2W69_003969 [Rheinheimera soli]|uniref:Uncharacterized protein n=1 Tax=Rheinheimera soli TaxID=443616 RepID=A0ABU1W4U3_9GAMM|nr:hypothetical protein [Rheinheimera soli]
MLIKAKHRVIAIGDDAVLARTESATQSQQLYLYQGPC